MSNFQRKIKPWVLPAAILSGFLFHDYIEPFRVIVPYLIFTMLFITFCRVKPRDFHFSKMIWELILIQLVCACGIFIALRWVNIDIAQAAFICFLCPTATAAPVVTGMLGGSIPRVATYSIVSNLVVAITAPFLFVWVGNASLENVSFIDEFIAIAKSVAPMIIGPLAIAMALYFIAPKVHHKISSIQGISFYLWAIALIIVVGQATAFMLKEPASAIPEMIQMAVVAAFVCFAQFWIGSKIGIRNGDRISAAQGLGQKNTILAIWMAMTYLNPIASIGPAAYIIWQNTFNSAQLYLKMRHETR